MTDEIKHECGLGLLRLRKPLSYYEAYYGSALWGLEQMFYLMQKQRDRGHQGAGLACVKLDMEPGRPYHERIREISSDSHPWTRVVKQVNKQLHKLKGSHKFPGGDKAGYLKKHYGYAGELYMGHVRYATHGDDSINACHPVIRTSNYKNRTLLLSGNFNLTNVDELFNQLVGLGQHPRYLTDTETMLERIGYYLDEEYKKLSDHFSLHNLEGQELEQKIAESLDIQSIMQKCAAKWDGGYVMGGIIGNGDAFIARDPNGIRPCYYYIHEDYIVAASERAAICAVFDIQPDNIRELQRGHLLVIKANHKNGDIEPVPFIEQKEKRSCVFERIYFSQGNDVKIYDERKNLGRYVFPKVLESLQDELGNTVFSYIPKSSEASFFGLMQAAEEYLNDQKIQKIKKLGPDLNDEEIRNIMNLRIRAEKVVHKDEKMRTFTSDDKSRSEKVSHAYDITWGSIAAGKDNLVCIDDSIVRGTTLRSSILKMLSRLKPKKIIITSSAPQIRYPDCYGIDMSQIGDLVAFQAAINLLHKQGRAYVLDDLYKEITGASSERLSSINFVKNVYAPFTEDEISREITQTIQPEMMECVLEIIYQPYENLAKAIPNHTGDWYFSGNYPTAGGYKTVNKSFVNFYEGKKERAYKEPIPA